MANIYAPKPKIVQQPISQTRVWVVAEPNGFYLPTLIRRTREEAIAAYTAHQGKPHSKDNDTWLRMYKDGKRARSVWLSEAHPPVR